MFSSLTGSARNIIALDIGSSCTKAAVVDDKGKLSHACPCLGITITCGQQHEQDAEEWWQAAASCIRKCLQDGTIRPSAISLTGQMQCLVLVSPQGQPLCRAIVHSDARAAQEAAHVESVHPDGPAALASLTGIWAGPCAVLPKLMWMMKNQGHLIQGDGRKVLVGGHSAVCMRLCGEACCDYTTASTTGLMDVTAGTWAKDLLTHHGIPLDILPRLVPGTQRVGVLSASAAQLLGLDEGVPIYHGCGDLAATSLGAGCTTTASLPYVYIGTSGWVAAVCAREDVSVREGVFVLSHPEHVRHVYVAAACNTAGGNVEKLVRIFHQDDERDTALDKVNALAASSPPGANGVLYLPYLNGERSPFQDEHARACFIGMSHGTTKADMHRAVLEAVAMSIRSLLQTLREACPQKITDEGGELFVVGGGSASHVWMQILADVTNRRITVLSPTEITFSTVRGAFLLAAAGEGWIDLEDAPSCDALHCSQRVSFEPCPACVEVYEPLYAVFTRMYDSLKSSFALMASLHLPKESCMTASTTPLLDLYLPNK